jgi:hypothetical protein
VPERIRTSDLWKGRMAIPKQRAPFFLTRQLVPVLTTPPWRINS